MVKTLIPLSYGSYTIEKADAGLFFSFADVGSPTSIPNNASSFKGRLEGGDIRFRLDGTDATPNSGELLTAGDSFVLDAGILRKASLITISGEDVVIKGHFYNSPAYSFSGGR